MFHNPTGDTGDAGGGDAARLAAARDAVWEDAAAGAPDDLALVAEVFGLRSVLAAQQYERVDALRREAVAAAAGRGAVAVEVAERSLRLEVAGMLRITETAVERMVTLADALVHRFPGTLDDLACARITERHAEILVDLLDPLDAPLRERLAEEAEGLAVELPVGSFRRALRRLIDTEQAATLAERHERAVSGRRVVLEAADDGMAWLHAHLPAVEAHAAWARLTAMGTALAARPGETRTLAQARADVLGDLLIDGDTEAIPREARGIRATVAVTVPALSLLGHDAGPAMLDGVGPIPIERAKQLCGSAAGWMRVLTHPDTGIVLSVGRTRYRPPASLRRLLRWRATRCMAPGCGIPADRCDLDHTLAWDHGGHTAADNLAPLCRGHHTVKHHGGWRVEPVPERPGALAWTSPSGRRYVVEPERRIPMFRPADHDPPPF